MTKTQYLEKLNHLREMFDRRIANGSEFDRTYYYCNGWRESIITMMCEDNEISVAEGNEIAGVGVELWRHMLKTGEKVRA